MTLIQVFDRLLERRANRIDFKTGQVLNCVRPSLVKYADDYEGEFEDITLEASEEGLCIHFNEGQPGDLRGEMRTLSDIARVV